MPFMDGTRVGLMGLVLAGLGCSGSTDSGSSSGGAYIAEADFAATYLQAACAMFQTCCGQNGLPFDFQKCSQGGWKPGAKPPYQTFYDPKRAGECVALMASMSDTCDNDSAVNVQMMKACGAVYSGLQPTGAPCTEGADCAGNYDGKATCSGMQVNGGMTWVCQVIEFGSAGDECAGGIDPLGSPGKIFPKCAAGLYCTDRSVCVAQSAEGQPCIGWVSCATGLVCGAGACMKAKKNGTACVEASECDSGFCTNGTCTTGNAFSGAQCGG